MAKKKYLNIYYMFSLVVLFVTFLGLFSNCYAITEDEYKLFIENSRESILSVYSSDYANNINTFLDNAKNQYASFTNKDIFTIKCRPWLDIEGYSNNCKFYYNNNQIYVNIPARQVVNMYRLTVDSGSTSTQSQTLNAGNYSVFNINDPTGNLLFVCSSTVTTALNNDTEYENSRVINYNNTFVPASSITLVATKSDYKFTFHDKDQLQVYLTGDYEIGDFTFYVERYINNEWQQFSDSQAWTELYGYENPYYINWYNLNYYPAGTYRYSALYGNNPEQAYYSDSFQIYDSFIDNPATGTVDSNGNIDINIDTGKTVDDIKDFLGGEPTTTENELENSFPQVEIEDPTHNFFAWIFTEIENIFITTEDKTFSFALFTGNTYTIHSNDITIPSSPLKTLVGLSVDFGICYYILKDIHKTIEKVKKGSFEEIASEDITANMV